MIRLSETRAFNFVFSFAFLLGISGIFLRSEAGPVQAQERARKLVFNSKDISPTIVFIGANCWQARRNYHEIRPTATGKFLIYNPNHNTGTEWTNMKDWPRGMYIPSSRRPSLTWSAWKKGSPGEIHGIKVENYSRILPGGQLTEEISIANEIKAPPSLLKFMSAFFGCDIALGFPVRDMIHTPPGPSSKAIGWLVPEAITWETVPTITFPSQVKVTKDWYDVVTGGAKDMDVLYRTDGAKGTKP
jgi:hypothetical protein